MKVFPLFIFHFFMIASIILDYGEGAISYGSLIKCVLNEYHTSGTIIASSINYESLERMKIIDGISREVSATRIPSAVINIGNLTETVKFYSKRTVCPLVVIIIDGITEIQKFQESIVTIDMGSTVWLVLFTTLHNEESCEFCRNPIGNPFNLKFTTEMLVSCCDSGYINKWRSKMENQTSILPLGKSSDKINGIEWYRNGTLYSHRNSLDGKEIRISIVKNSLYVQRKDSQFRGYIGAVFTELSRAMNFTVSTVVEVDTYGAWDESAAVWTGGIGGILRGEVDICVADFVMSEARMHVVDFTLPLTTTEFILYIKRSQGVALQWNSYFKAFHLNVWIAIIIFLLTIPVILIIIEYEKGSSLFNRICEHYLGVWATFCLQGLPESPVLLPSKIVHFSISVLAIIIYTAYAGSIISNLATQSSYSPFDTMEQFVNDGSYKLIILKESSAHAQLKTSNNSLLMKMRAMMKPDDSLPYYLDEAIEQVCNGKVAFFFKDTLMKTMNHPPCDIAHIPTGETRHIAMTLQLKSEYTGLMNYYIQRFQVNGVLNRLYNEYFPTKSPAESPFETVTIAAILPLLAILAAGFMTAFTIFFIEMCKFCQTSDQEIPVENCRSFHIATKAINSLLSMKNQLKNFHGSRDHLRSLQQPNLGSQSVADCRQKVEDEVLPSQTLGHAWSFQTWQSEFQTRMGQETADKTLPIFQRRFLPD